MSRPVSPSRFVLALLGWASLSCSSGIGTTPTRTSDVAAGPVVNIAGTWTGTLESSNFGTRMIKMLVVQSGNCVDGVWDSLPAEWTGAISGYATVDSYSGQISLERTTEDGSRCTAVGKITGPVTGTTLRWTGDSLSSVGQCKGDIPRSIVVVLQRE